MAHILSVPRKDTAAAAAPPFVLFSTVLMFVFLSVCMEIFKSHLFPFSVVDTKAVFSFLIPSHQTKGHVYSLLLPLLFWTSQHPPPAAPRRSNLAMKTAVDK